MEAPQGAETKGEHQANAGSGDQMLRLPQEGLAGLPSELGAGFDTQTGWAQGLVCGEGGGLRLETPVWSYFQGLQGLHPHWTCDLEKKKKIHPPTQRPNLELGLSSGSRNKAMTTSAMGKGRFIQ